MPPSIVPPPVSIGTVFTFTGTQRIRLKQRRRDSAIVEETNG
ncbi:hypothetical protein [Billgrantia desiderata]|nr:hypothetical protein [Halomonas desiderata]